LHVSRVITGLDVVGWVVGRTTAPEEKPILVALFFKVSSSVLDRKSRLELAIKLGPMLCCGRYQYFLQLTKDMSEGRLVAPFQTTVLLASLAVQCEFYCVLLAVSPTY